MTTDITELAQSLKAAAEKASPGNWRAFQYHDGRCGVGGGNHDEIMVCEHISKKRPHDALFIALANPANILALVEALEGRNALVALQKIEIRELNAELEKAQQVDEELCKLLPPGAEYMDPPDGGDVTPLEGVRRMVADYRQRIAELREWNAGLAQESFERQQRISELLEGKVGNALLERENHHVVVVGKLTEHTKHLESRAVKLPDDEDGQAYGFGKWANGKLPATAGTMTIAYCEDAWRAAFEVFSSTAGIKVEAE
ncbi:TPA: ead/Ea22-like family protein [Klebsiella quasipneumoniae]